MRRGCILGSWSASVRRLVRVPAAAALLLAGSAEPARAVDQCTRSQVETWLRQRNDNLGVHAYDPNPFLAPDIVPLPGRPPQESCPSQVDFAADQEGRAHDGIHAWVFAHPCKLAVCGEPQSFEENRGMVVVSGEYDLNNNLRFGPEFRAEKLAPHLCATDAFASGGSTRNLALQEPRLCFPDTDTLHVEITPPTSFRPLFRRLWVESPPWGWLRWRNTLVRRTACVYGPFVADTAHATLAEIHPTQMYWWNERALGEADPFEGDGPHALFVLQDASNRYTRPHHFVLEREPPQGSVWKPWAGAPVDAVFEIPFWSRRGEPPRFNLYPYEYEGVKAPAPERKGCLEGEVAELRAEVDGMPVVVASACNATKVGRPAMVELDLATICRCDPAAASGGPDDGSLLCPGEDGFLGRLTITARTGSSKEWGEGALGLLLVDSRSPERRTSVAVEAGEAIGVAPNDASLLVSWKTVPGGPGWQPVEVARGELARAEAAMRSLYDEARWPSEVPRPLTSLWRVSEVDVRAGLMVPHGRERSRNEVESVRYSGRATSVQSRSTVELPEGPAQTSAERRLAFESLWSGSAVEPFRIDLRVEARARYAEPPQVASRQEQGEPSRNDTLESTWTLWTHALGSQPALLWHQSARVLCDFSLQRARGRESGRPGPEAAPAAGQPAAADPMVYENVRIATARVLKDEVVSVSELTLLVRNVERACSGTETMAPERPVRAAADAAKARK